VRFTPTEIDGAFLLDLEPKPDERGFFARTFDAAEFAEHGLDARVVQANLSFNDRAGTLRGMHYQVEPALEPKLVRCTAGAVYDAIVDMRPRSPTRGAVVGAELTAENRRMLYVPGGCAHGYLTLVDATEVSYQVGEYYTPDAERGLRWDDPALAIPWPRPVEVVSAKDASWPLLPAPG
jgi:dTDP-4-dehydrorhamnose 3,5-epimerase